MPVESLQLTNFYQSILVWPKTESELSFVAQSIANLVDAQAVGILALADGSKMNFQLAVRASSETFEGGGELFEEFLRNQIKRGAPATSGAPRVHQFQVAGSKALSLFSATHLAVAPMSAEATLNEGGPAESHGQRPRRNLGWIAVATSRALNAREETLLTAAAQRLSSLYEIQQLESALQLRSQFLSIASHELKTPLTSIYGVLQLQERMLRLKKDETPSVQQERQQSFLKMVIRQVQRLNELIDGLLDVSRIQNGRFTIEPADTDVATLLREAASGRLSMVSQEAGVKLQVEAPEHLGAWVDPLRIEEVINNLVMNAIRFSPEGGTVRVRLREDGGAMRLSVRDQGPALAPEDQERIFQPFERTARTSRFGGLGLGLFISRQIAQLHGGNVSVLESQPGKGNLIEAYFPVRSGNLISA